MTQIMLIYLDHYMCDATRVTELWNETVTSSMLADISDNIPLNEYKRKSTNVVVIGHQPNSVTNLSSINKKFYSIL